MEFVATVEAGGHTYGVSTLDTFTQWHLARKMGPLLIPILPMVMRLYAAGQKKMVFGDLMKEIATYLPDALSILASMPQEDADFVLLTCLGALHRKEKTGWAKVRSAGALMYSDIKLPAMLQLTYEVIKANLGDFIDTGLLTTSEAGETAGQS